MRAMAQTSRDACDLPKSAKPFSFYIAVRLVSSCVSCLQGHRIGVS